MAGGKRPKSYRDAVREIGPYIDLGMRFAVYIVVTAGAGFWLDTKLHTTPLLLILGFIFGAIGGFWTIYRAIYTKKRNESGIEQEK